MKIYTRTGDNGSTSLVGGKRVAKDDPRLEAYGTIDELSAHLGYLSTFSEITPGVLEVVRFAQNKLFNIGAYLATESGAPSPCQGLTQADIEKLEQAIDLYDDRLPPLANFVLPGGSRMGAWAHVCRTVCRRAERRVITLSRDAHIDPIVVRFVNRLSDYLFTLSRVANLNASKEEIFWDKQC